MDDPKRARSRKRRTQPRDDLHTTAPAPDPTEPAWTRWLANLLRVPEAGDIVWSAFCELVASEAGARREHEDLDLATSSDWRQAALVHLESRMVTAERATDDGGFLDLTVTTPDLLLVLENKLWEGWHDRPGLRQEESSARAARMIAGGRRIGLVFFSAYEADRAMRAAAPRWIFITWAQLAQAMRRRVLVSKREATLDRATLMPVHLTIAAIERDLLGFSLSALSEEPHGRWRHLDILTRMCRHLESVHEQHRMVR